MQELFIRGIRFLTFFTWIDGIILLVLIFYMIEGYAIGALSGLSDIVSFLLALIIALKLYKPFSELLVGSVHLPQSIAPAIGFISLSVVVVVVLRIIQGRITEKVRHTSLFMQSPLSEANRIIGILPGLVSGCVLVAFFLTVLLVLPVSVQVKEGINASKIANQLLSGAQSFEKDITTVSRDNRTDLLTFFTVEPATSGSVALDFTYNKGVADTEAEMQMITMVNGEREKQGLAPLLLDAKLQMLGREHSQDMLSRGYFSHYTPEGKSPFDRMTIEGIGYSFAGENLAFSSNATLAMQGLMQSPGHRANILSANFKRIGIGIINAGTYGEMFSQEFTD